LNDHDYLGVDISTAVEVARKRFLERGYSGDFLQLNLMELPFPDHSIDMIFSEGVLHHTDNTELAIRYLTTKLKPGGRFLFYVYAKKAVLREFTDDHIRGHLAPMTDEEAWEALKPVTERGIALGKLKLQLDVPETISFLGIAKGKIDLQRFFYWNLCKLFYREDYSFEEMHHINFDWFRPLNCHRHTREEVYRYCAQAQLLIEHFNEQPSGFTVVARKL
jgi:SAM-dependent methyltransferase